MDIKSFCTLIGNRVLVLDGAMGTMIQRYNLTDDDFRGNRFAGHPARLAGCNDLLCLTHPEIIGEIHNSYLMAGADIICTNTFNANAISLADYDLHNDHALIREINRSGAAIARKSSENSLHIGRCGRALVAGSIGPTNKSATMSPDVSDPAVRNISYDELYSAYFDQCAGLIEGGVDLMLFETVFDTLNLKAGLDAAQKAMNEYEVKIPIMVSATISNKSGRLLCGQTIEAFVASIEGYPNVVSIGLNCSFGPKDMIATVKSLGACSPHYVSSHPNAGLPDALGNYNVSPEDFAEELRPMLDARAVNIIGGCCGTTPEHIAALRKVAENARPHIPAKFEPALRLSGIDILEVRPENNFMVIGERCNVAGSRKFLRLIKEKNYDEAIRIAAHQVESGASVIDINMDDPLIDAVAEMTHFLRLYASEPEVARVPVMVDSSNWDVIESALKNLQGKSIVNSISLKEGEESFVRKAKRIRELGAAVVVMAFDEDGQADTYERKIAISERAYRLLTEKCGFIPEDIIFDVNVMAVATGLEEHARYGIDFIKAVRWIKQNLPGARTSGGVSNLSFAFRGKNVLREAMHTVFLYHAIAAGLDMAIMNPSAALTYEEIDHDLRSLIEDVVLSQRTEAAEELSEYAASEEANAKMKCSEEARDMSIPAEQRLKNSIIAGKSDSLYEDLDELSKSVKAVDIVEGPLMEGMRKVGDLFGEGKMFLPQVVKTARVMKMAVDHLKPLLLSDVADGEGKRAGKVLLATVKGDVHDIGKNIVSIVLGCNNFEVIDLGVMVPAETIVETALREKPDIICLSGLITPSLAEMTTTARTLKAAGLDIPLLVGGATTSTLHTALKIAPEYCGPVMQMKDASQNPLVASKLLNPEEKTDFIRELKESQARMRLEYASKNDEFVSIEEARSRGKEKRRDFHSVQPACGIGNLLVRNFSIDEIESFINWKMLLHAWGLHGHVCNCGCEINKESDALISDAKECLKEIAYSGKYDGFGIVRILPAFSSDQISCAEYVSASSDVIFIEGRAIPVLRQQKKDSDFLSLSDFVGSDDYVGVFMAGAGRYIDSEVKRLSDSGNTYKSLLLQSLADRLAEASSEYMHYLVRKEYWGYSPNENMDVARILRGEYAGIRPAMGYPMLPDQLLNKTVFDLLLPESGKKVVLTDNGAMSPSSTVSGLYISNPDSHYFMVGAIASDQLLDYAQKRGLTESRIIEILNL